MLGVCVCDCTASFLRYCWWGKWCHWCKCPTIFIVDGSIDKLIRLSRYPHSSSLTEVCRHDPCLRGGGCSTAADPSPAEESKAIEDKASTKELEKFHTTSEECVCVCVCVCVWMCRWVSWTSIAKQSTTHLAIPRQSGSHMHSHLCHLATCTSCFWECAVYTAVSVKQQCTIMWTSSELKEVGCRLGDRRGEGFDVTFASYYPQGRLLPVKYT